MACNPSDFDWIGLMGSCIGAVVAIVCACITVYHSNKKMNEQLEKLSEQIKLQKEEFEEQKRSQKEQYRLNNLPILDVKLVSNMGDNISGIFCDSLVNPEVFSCEGIVEKTLNLNLSISNIGLGAAIDLKFACKSNEYEGMGISSSESMRSLRVNDVKIKSFSIMYPLFKTKPIKCAFHSYKFDIIIYYKDILGNNYAKTVKYELFTEGYVNENYPNGIVNLMPIGEDYGYLVDDPIEFINKGIE